GGVALRMRLRETGDAETEMDLFQRLGVRKNAAAHFRRRLAGGMGAQVAIAIEHTAEALSDLFHHRVVAKVARRRDEDPARLIARLEKSENIFAAESVDGLLAAA